MDSAFIAQDVILDKTSQEVLHHKQIILFNETKYQALNDLYRISNTNYSDLVTKNLDLNTQLRLMTSNRDKWRAYGITATILGVVVALISIN